jgi:glycosyltransferase involved in cell wall biosynthesis
VNILYVHERPAYFGGAEQNIADSVKALRRRGVNCHLAYSSKFPADPEFLQLFDSYHPCSDLENVSAKNSSSPLNVIAAQVSADCLYLHRVERIPASLHAVKCHTVQMVHDHVMCCPRRHKYFAIGNHVCTKAAGWRCYLDAAFLKREPESLVGVSFSGIQEKLNEMHRYQSLASFVVASEFMRAELLQNGFSQERIHLLPTAVRQQGITSSPPISSTPTVLFVGQLIKEKGVDFLLHALAKIKVPFSAVIVGKGNAEDSLRRLCAELKLIGQVEFRGWVNHEQLANLYAGARVVAIPSRWPEPHSLVGMEAMQHARPVVAFNVGGIPDWLQDGRTGFLVPQQDVQAFSQALLKFILDQQLAQRMGEVGLAAAGELFSFDTYIDGLLSVLLPGENHSSGIRHHQLVSA